MSAHLLWTATLVAMPASLLLAFLVASAISFLAQPLAERHLARATEALLGANALAAAALALVMVTRQAPIFVELSPWIQTSHGLLVPTLRLDLGGALMLALFMGILGLVGRFSSSYLHREPGHDRFFALLWLFAAGVCLIILAARADLMMVGWELVGLTSALLIGFFRDRRAPMQAGLRAWTVYRACDAALILAIVGMHHEASSVDWQTLARSAPAWSPGHQALWGGLLIVGAMGKSAQAPLSGWLPRAMEGPTPSSALFYGAISVHLGAYLLLLARPILATQPGLLWAVGLIGATTALSGGLIAPTRPDVKTAQAWATSAQVGVLWIEIALGWTTLAWVHMASHALWRGALLLRAPGALRAWQARHDALHAWRQAQALATKEAAQHTAQDATRWRQLQHTLYAWAISHMHMDALLERVIVGPTLALSGALSALDERLSLALDGPPRRDRQVAITPWAEPSFAQAPFAQPSDDLAQRPPALPPALPHATPAQASAAPSGE